MVVLLPRHRNREILPLLPPSVLPDVYSRFSTSLPRPLRCFSTQWHISFYGDRSITLLLSSPPLLRIIFSVNPVLHSPTITNVCLPQWEMYFLNILEVFLYPPPFPLGALRTLSLFLPTLPNILLFFLPFEIWQTIHHAFLVQFQAK